MIEALPTVAHCESCGRGFLWNKRGDRCPACDGIVSESAPCGGPPRCPAQWHEPCLCMVGWRHCPIHQDEGRGEEKL